jgi:hypothetical protein
VDVILERLGLEGDGMALGGKKKRLKKYLGLFFS